MAEYITKTLQTGRQVEVLKESDEIARQIIDITLNYPSRLLSVFREYPSLSNPGILDRIRRLGLAHARKSDISKYQDALYLRVAIRGLERATDLQGQEREKAHQLTSQLIDIVQEIENGF